jgi:hypothetical protein
MENELESAGGKRSYQLPARDRISISFLPSPLSGHQPPHSPQHANDALHLRSFSAHFDEADGRLQLTLDASSRETCRKVGFAEASISGGKTPAAVKQDKCGKTDANRFHGFEGSFA